MRSNYLGLCMVVLSAMYNGQVGINIEEPEETLDVGGTLRVRKTDKDGAKQTHLLGIDKDGTVIKATSKLVAVETVVAKAPVDQVISNPENYTETYKKFYPELRGLSKKIIIPKGKKYTILFQYSMPAGIYNREEDPLFYYEVDGNKFVKNFVGYVGAILQKKETGEAPELIEDSARKTTIPKRVSLQATAGMLTISNIYTEVVDNRMGTQDLEIEYSLKGYVEAVKIDDTSYVEALTGEFKIRFGMWAAIGENFGWGKASFTYLIIDEDGL